MSDATDTDLIDDVSPGDVITVDRGARRQAVKVVFKDTSDAGFLLTLEGDGGETFQLEVAAGTRVMRSLASKWESAQSPTPRAET